MENKKVTFEIGIDQIDIKPLLQREFLELKMKAVSSANPNNNGSWFTEESLQASIESFRNKPILGYFEDGDFVSHDGEWEQDLETGIEYWDTLGAKGERILGLIRGDDELVIEKDKEGLSWISFSCALWVQYNFKQVKRLIKDAKRALTNGSGPAKNVSVEVEVTDYEILDSGIIKINKFNLIGVTILGSRKGVKVHPGIEGAGVSVVDIMGKDFFEKQTSALRVAYEKLDNLNKEEKSIMENTVNAEEVVADTVEMQEETITEESTEEVCPECGKNPCECESKEEEKCETCEEDEGKEPEEEEKCSSEEEVPEEERCEEHEDAPEEKCEEEALNYEQMYNELKASYDALQESFNELQKSANETATQINALNETVKAYQKQEFLKQAEEFLHKDGLKLSEEQYNKFYTACENNEIKDFEELKTKVALETIEQIVGGNEKESFEAPVTNPDTNAAFSKNSVEGKKLDKWSKLRNYINK